MNYLSASKCGRCGRGKYREGSLCGDCAAQDRQRASCRGLHPPCVRCGSRTHGWGNAMCAACRKAKRKADRERVTRLPVVYGGFNTAK